MTHRITTTLSERLYVSGNSASAIQTQNGVTWDAGNYTLDFSCGNNFNLLLTSVSMLSAPLNAIAGQSGIIFLTQDSTGNRVMSFDPAWHFPNSNVPSLSTAISAVDGLCYMVRVGGSSPIISCQLIQGV